MLSTQDPPIFFGCSPSSSAHFLFVDLLNDQIRPPETGLICSPGVLLDIENLQPQATFEFLRPNAVEAQATSRSYDVMQYSKQIDHLLWTNVNLSVNLL